MVLLKAQLLCENNRKKTGRTSIFLKNMLNLNLKMIGGCLIKFNIAKSEKSYNFSTSTVYIIINAGIIGISEKRILKLKGKRSNRDGRDQIPDRKFIEERLEKVDF